MTAIWVAVAVLAVVVVALWCAHSETLDKHKRWIDCIAFDRNQCRIDIERIRKRQVEQESWREALDVAFRIGNCEAQLQCVALILDHLGLEIQEPTTATTPRRLVPKVERGEG